MAISLNISENLIDGVSRRCADSLDSVAHLMPCHIRHNGDAPVSTYFTPTIRRTEEDLKCSFRGHPITGRVCKLPEGLTGYVAQEKKLTECDGQQRNVHIVGKFSKFYYWDNKTPPKNFSLLATIGLTQLIHSPTDSS